MDVQAAANGGANNLAQRQEKFELGVWLALSSWQALTVAVQNLWGGPDSVDKRDWFAGAVTELFTSESLSAPEVEDVEERLLQIMEDEFEVVVDDGSSALVAQRIMVIWEETGEGNFGTVDTLHTQFKDRKGKEVNAVRVGPSSDDEDSVDEEDEDEDVEMGDAPQLVAVKEKVAPEVDEHGFTKVVGKKRR